MEFRDYVFKKLSTISEYRVWVLLGDNALISNYCINLLKKQLLDSSKLVKIFSKMPLSTNATVLTDIQTDTESDNSLAVCSLDELWKKPGRTMSGKWWCCASYDNMSKKDRQNFQNYVKAPDKNAVLVVTVSDFKLIREFKKSRQYKNNEYCHITNIQYPSKTILMDITNKLFREYHIQLSDKQQTLFITKMSSAYDEYKDSVEEAAKNIKEQHENWNDAELNTVSDLEFNRATKEIQHFEIDDLLKYMTQPFNSGQTLNGNRKIHKLLAVLLETQQASDVCKRLKYRVTDMLAYRTAINNGLIPVTVPYNVGQVQEKLPETTMYNKIKKAPAFLFKRNAYISSQTSLEDWFYVYTMLESLSVHASEEEYVRVLLSIINRTALSNDRLMNDLKVKNTLDEGLVTLNGILYSNWWKSLDLSDNTSE